MSPNMMRLSDELGPTFTSHSIVVLSSDGFLFKLTETQ